MPRPRKTPEVHRFADVERNRARPFYVYAYPGKRRRMFTFDERDTAEAFIELLTTRGHDAAAAAYDARTVATKRVQGGRAHGVSLARLAADFAASRPKASTRQAYALQARYLAEHPATSRVDVAALTVNDMTSYVEFLRARPNGRGGVLAPGTVRMAWVLARTVLDRAVRQGLIPSNPARAVEDAPRASRKGTTDSTAHAIDRRQFEAIAAHLAPDVRTFVEVLWHSGLRIGEALALTWDDVQPVAPGAVELFVRRTITLADDTARKGGTKRWVMGTTKSGRARRVYAAAEAFDGLDRGPATDVVFTASRDYYAHAWRVARARAAAEGHDVATVRLHDLRHSRVTALLRAGKAPHLVSEAMGHSSVAFTLDRYAHAMPSDGLSLLA